MLLEHGGGDALGERFREVDRLPLDDRARPAVDLAVVDGLREVVRQPGGAEVTVEVDVDDERLAEIPFRREGAMVAVEDHALEKNPVFSHSCPSAHVGCICREAVYQRRRSFRPAAACYDPAVTNHPRPDPASAIAARAIWLASPRRVELREESVSAPGPGEVRVRAIASAISQGTEMLVYRGEVPADLPLDLPTLAGSFQFPIKYGYASVGRVLDTGQGVDTVRAGDAVFVLHPHQSAYTAPASLTVRLPDVLDPLLGVFCANVETAVNVLLDTPLKLGETAVVFGLGTVGLLITQLLRRAGAGLVIGIDPLERRRALGRSIGLDHALAPDEHLAERIRDLTDGRGADIAIEVSGAPAALQMAIDCVAVEGTVVAVSWYGTKPVPLMLGGHFHRGRVRLRSSQVGGIDPSLSARWDRDRRTALVLDLLPRLRLAELISHRFPVAEAEAAYRLVDQHPGEAVQVVLTYDET